MTRTARLFPAFAFAAVLMTPAAAFDAAEGQQVEDLRRRIEVIEQQLFQQRLSQPVSPQNQAVLQLEMRLRQLETEVATSRISSTAAEVTSRRNPAPGEKSIEARLQDLETQRAADTKALAALTKRVEALEKPAAKPRAVKK